MRHGQELSEDELITLHEEECLGVCDFAPVAQVNFANHDSVTPERMRELISALRSGDVPEPSRGGPRDGELQERVARARGSGGGAGMSADVRTAAHPRLGRPGRDRDRRLPREGRLRGAEERAQHGARRDHRHREGVRSARPRRRRVPDRHEVVVRPDEHGQADLRRRELRRIRAGDVQQPRARRTRPASAAGGDRDRGARDRLPDRVHLRPRRVPGAGPDPREGDRRGLRAPGSSGRGSPGATSTSTSCCTGERAPTSAARRPRSSTPSRGSGGSRACVRPSPRSRASTPRRR